MEMQQVSNSCYAVLNEKNRVCDASAAIRCRTSRERTGCGSASGR